MESRQEFGDRFTTYLAMHDGLGVAGPQLPLHDEISA